MAIPRLQVTDKKGVEPPGRSLPHPKILFVSLGRVIDRVNARDEQTRADKSNMYSPAWTRNALLPGQQISTQAFIPVNF